MTGVSGTDASTSAVFVEPKGTARRPADVVLLIVGLMMVWLTGLSFRNTGTTEGQLIEFLQDLPMWTTTLFRWAYALGALYALVLFVGALVKGRMYLGLVRVMLVALLGATAAVAIVLLVVAGEWPRVLPELSGETVAQYLALRITVVTALLAVAMPYLTRPFRRLGWIVVLTMVVSAVGIGVAFPSHALGAIGMGLAVAGLTNVVFRSPDGYPNLEVIAASMDSLGIVATDLHPSARQSWGVRSFDAVSSDRQPTRIKVYSRDANDAQFWSKVWRFLWYRDSGPSLTITRLQQVEHEALMHFMAAQCGATVASVLTAARTDNGDAILALGWDGVPLARADANSLNDNTLRSLWTSVARLHEAEISHGRLNLEAVRLTETDAAVISEFAAGSIAASDSRINTDVAELLFSTAVVVGADRAVAGAADGLGTEHLLDAAPYLQAPAISSTNRTTTKDKKALLESLRNRVAELAGTEPPEPASLKRVTGKDILGGGLALIAGYVLISELAGLDWSTIFEDLKNAHWAWILAGFIAAQFTLVTEGISLMSVVERELPAKPTLYLQSASTFVGIALPGPAGRVAMITTFLRSYGVSPVLAVTQSSVDSIAGFITEVAILIVAVAFSDFRLGIGSEQNTDWSAIGTIVLVVVGVAVLALALLPKLRARIVPTLRKAWSGLSVVVRQPTRLIWLFGSNFSSRVVNAVALWLVLQAFGITLPLSTTLFITVAAVLLSGLVPVPGGVGVAEAAIAAGLVGAGVEENVAFAVAVVYRLVQFYLPPVMGYFALRWLEREDYV